MKADAERRPEYESRDGEMTQREERTLRTRRTQSPEERAAEPDQPTRTRNAAPSPPGTRAADGVGVRVEDLRKTFTSGQESITAVDGVSLRIAAGGTAALTGPSGSGKSTLLHLLGAIEQAESGTIEVGGVEVTSARRSALARYRASVGFVFQRFHLLPALTARDNVLAPLLARRAGRGAREAQLERADALLAAVGLEGRENALPSQLSGGQQQRVAIARALIGDPGLLLADEPTGNLDSATGAEIIELLLRLNEEHGTTMIIATHDPGIAARCTRTISMLDGSVVHDTAEEPGLRA